MYCLNVHNRTVFDIWPDDESFELKHVAEFLILITIYIYIVLLLTGIKYYIIATHNRMAPVKIIKRHFQVLRLQNV